MLNQVVILCLSHLHILLVDQVVVPLLNLLAVQLLYPLLVPLVIPLLSPLLSPQADQLQFLPRNQQVFLLVYLQPSLLAYPLLHLLLLLPVILPIDLLQDLLLYRPPDHLHSLQDSLMGDRRHIPVHIPLCCQVVGHQLSLLVSLVLFLLRDHQDDLLVIPLVNQQ